MKQILILLACIVSMHMHSQFQLQNVNLGETTTNMQAISIGSVTNNADIKARLHVNNFSCNSPSSGTFNGLLFRSDGDQSVNNYWQMFTGSAALTQTERFHVRTIPNGVLGSDGYHTYLETVNPGSESALQLMTAEIQARRRGTRLGDFCSVVGGPDIVQFGDYN